MGAMAMAMEVKVTSTADVIGLAARLVPADGQAKAAGDGHGDGHEIRASVSAFKEISLVIIQWVSGVVYQWLAP